MGNSLSVLRTAITSIMMKALIFRIDDNIFALYEGGIKSCWSLGVTGRLGNEICGIATWMCSDRVRRCLVVAWK